MSIDHELFKSWSRLSTTDLGIIKFVVGRYEVIRTCPELCGFLAALTDNELDHRNSLRVTPEHPCVWRTLDNGKLAKCYNGAFGIKRACIQSNKLVEWASLLVDAVCDEMAARLQVSQQLADAENN